MAARINPEDINAPVFYSQGGSLVREVESLDGYVYILLEDNAACGLMVGDTMPKEWDLIPANKIARMLYE